MHGRLKVKTTEEQAEAKRLEREKKLHQYVTATKAIFEKVNLREAGTPSSAPGTKRKVLCGWGHLAMWAFETLALLARLKNPCCHSVAFSVAPSAVHCWDYRRFVVQRSKVLPQDELAFSDSLITRNFSNYSSWHYRSLLLPQLYPDPQHQGRITEEILLKELELVQNAFFTDPNDQSAWFYHRWLLGRGDLEPTIRCVYVNRENTSLAVAFSHPVAVAPASHDLIVFGDESPLVVRWRTPDRKNKPGLMCELSVEKSTVLQSELESCKELQALEPENKWCLLTIILLMRALDPLVYEQDTLRYFAALKAADPMRSSYLNDLRSKFLIENSVLKMEYADSRVVDLSQKSLTSLCHLEHLLLVTHLNLSDNLLSALPPTLAMMRCLEVMEADDNQIESLEGLPPLPCLEELSLRNNRIQRASALRSLAAFPALAQLNLQGNPLCETPGVRSELARLLPKVTTILLA
ncbi:geranylgeranyl transferase type-2 subunit alpha [Protobothrops mucrosquamatus]|uniref:geranylgeranyl transferase type-2 subunit alpha n=1 Tax=Protobothrops mucrosquamatus TaxID=103944 RepID=UPI0010FB91E5|nr:geranylgeranyl transferase type-2 subunit alpha [Protobothrops mucrosquamatus]